VRLCLLVLGLVVLGGSVVRGQELGEVRSWTGTLGKSQFGVFSNNGTRLVFADGNDAVIVDTVDGRNSIRLSGHTKPVSVARYSGDGTRIVTVGQDETIRRWDAESGKQISEVAANTGSPSTILSVSKNGSLIGFTTGSDRIMRVMDLFRKVERQRIGLKAKELHWRSVSPDCRLAMSNGITNLTTFWDTSTGNYTRINNGHHNYCGQFSHDGTAAILGGGFAWDIWNIQRKTKVAAGTVTGGHVYAIASSKSGDRLLTGLSDGTVWVWDVRAGKELMVLRGHEKAVRAVMVSPDRRYAVSGDQLGTIILWRIRK